MKKNVLFVGLMLLMVIGVTPSNAAEPGDRDQNDFFYPGSPLEQLMQFLLLLIIIISIIVIIGIVVTEFRASDKILKNPDHLIIPSVTPSQPSQYAFMEKSCCSQCGRSIDSESQLCPYCGNNLKEK
jgi:hypothetical protein